MTPASSYLTLSESSVDVGTEVTAKATVIDYLGELAPGATVTFSVTNSAQLSANTCETDDDGQCSVLITNEVAEDVEVRATVADGGSPADLEGSPATIHFNALPPAPAPEPDFGQSTLDGGWVSIEENWCPGVDDPVWEIQSGASEVTFIARDADGDPVPNVEVLFETGYPFVPTLPRVTTDAAGVARVLVTWAEGADRAWSGWDSSVPVTARVGDTQWTSAVLIGRYIVERMGGFASVEALTSGEVAADGVASHEVLVSSFSICQVPKDLPVFVFIVGSAQVSSSDTLTPYTRTLVSGEVQSGWIVDTGPDAVAILKFTNTTAEKIFVDMWTDPSYDIVPMQRADGSPFTLVFTSDKEGPIIVGPDLEQSSVVVTPPFVAVGSSTQATVTLKDSYGNPVAGVVVTFRIEGYAEVIGDATCFTDMKGQCSVDVTSDSAGHNGLAEVVVSVGGEDIVQRGFVDVFIGLPRVMWSEVEYQSVILGGTQVATASEFPPGELVDVTLFSDPVDLGTYVADSRGVVRVAFTVPSTLGIGTHTIKFVGRSSGSISATFEVQALVPPPGPLDPPTSHGIVANTGGTVAPTGTFPGLVALVAAIGVVLAALVLTRRQEAAH